MKITLRDNNFPQSSLPRLASEIKTQLSSHFGTKASLEQGQNSLRCSFKGAMLQANVCPKQLVVSVNLPWYLTSYKGAVKTMLAKVVADAKRHTDV